MDKLKWKAFENRKSRSGISSPSSSEAKVTSGSQKRNRSAPADNVLMSCGD
ncbi:Uncharacterized protein DAT39_017067 [Clarias magur]|uniref:Uncharacterized protein n=1 Tax=Clarias magur TaxID=1594786 RepID=A0A8J4WVY0_CLAMG|nr:Uncharacterized protein DAT39_017067 [Clarias magur]